MVRLCGIILGGKLISDVPEDGIDLLLVRLVGFKFVGNKKVAKILQRTQESMLETNF